MSDTDTDRHTASHDDTVRPGESNRQSKADGSDVAAEGRGEGPADSNKDGAKDQEKDQQDQKHKADEETRRKRRPLVITIGVIVVLLIAAGGFFYWFTTRNLESTDDAYTDGRAVTIASQVTGTVLSLDVNDNQFVKKDQLLIHIDPRQYVKDRDPADGALAAAKAQYSGQQLGAKLARKNFPAKLEQAQAHI